MGVQFYLVVLLSYFLSVECQEFVPMSNHDEAIGLGVCDEHRRDSDYENDTAHRNDIDQTDLLPESIRITDPDYDPIIRFQRQIDMFMFGSYCTSNRYKPTVSKSHEEFTTIYPTGSFMRAEMIGDVSGAHLPHWELIFRGHSTLKITDDRMQTALDAFYIFVFGDIRDIKSISPSFILNSAKTISMMKISVEKKRATWYTIKGKTKIEDLDFATLELYKPLIRYVSAGELARLNLNDPRILSFIGTHQDLNRHQVGIIAHRYIEMNPNWMQPRYLNLMNNLLCGVPIQFMRQISINNYLQLNHQLFYHIKACDKLQQRFFLNVMSRSQALGKQYSWDASDVARLGYLMTELTGAELQQVVPEAMAGLTAQVMNKMKPENLLKLSDMQERYLNPKALNIFAKKVRDYEDKVSDLNNGGSQKDIINNYEIFIQIILMISSVLIFLK